eukprot:TRINITY_DN5235_c0_g1_i1.p1 TRINITY_DN5235_c0_g1~~TRINITY_DN5235_c0_g1_i1.p1  ORF type:complete len:411 (+),score=98.69 TRINITY_DN5235_c0_g1_i1:276-1508(+)
MMSSRDSPASKISMRSNPSHAFYEQVLHRAEAEVELLLQSFAEEVEILTKLRENRKILAFRLEEVANHFKPIGTEWADVASWFSRGAEHQSSLVDLSSKLSVLVNGDVKFPLEELLKDVRAAKEMKRNFEKAKSELEAKQTTLAALKAKKAMPSQIDRVQVDCDVRIREVNKLEKMSLNAAIETANQCESELLSRLSSYFEGNSLYFQKGAAVLSGFATQIRLHSEKKTSEFEHVRRNLRSGYRVFGESLDILAEREQSEVPMIVLKSIRYLEPHGGKIGLFRVSGPKSHTDYLRRAIDEGKEVNLSGVEDHNVVCSLFKMYLRELPEPMFTFELFPILIGIADKFDTSESAIPSLRSAIARLSSRSKSLTRHVIGFIHSLSLRHEENKMDSHNLATVFAPTILYSDKDN